MQTLIESYERHTNTVENIGVDRIRLASEIISSELIEMQAASLIEGYLKRTSRESIEIKKESFHNAESALFEQLTAAGDVSSIDFEGDQQEIHQATLERILNGYGERMPYWEQERRFYEVCEELYVYSIQQRVMMGVLRSDTVVGTCSDFPSNASSDNEAFEAGYRFLNKKGMVRMYSFHKENGVWVRRLEQVSRSNSNNGSAAKWFSARGYSVENHPTKILSLQFIGSSSEFKDGVVSFVEQLDKMGEEPLLYGEPIAEAKRLGRPNYSDVRIVSKERRNQMNDIILELAMLDKTLQQDVRSGAITYSQKLALYNKRQQELIDQVCVLAPEYAVDARGEEASVFYYAAADALARDDKSTFAEQMKRAKQTENKFAAVACGGKGSVIGSRDEDEDTFKEVSDKKENWKFKQGICRMKSCPTRPGKTQVGPCSICRRCQGLFDSNINPDGLKASLFNSKKPNKRVR